MANYNRIKRSLKKRIDIDLQNFAEDRVTDAGELGIDRHFRRPLYLTLGRDLLELSRIDFPSGDDEAGMSDHAFVIRKLGPDPASAPAIIIEQTRRIIGQVNMPKLGALTLYGGMELVVGRQTTPELQLSETVDPEHMNFRIGNMWGNVHFADLDSEYGTHIYVDRIDERCLDMPRRLMAAEEVHGQMLLGPYQTEVDQRWMR